MPGFDDLLQGVQGGAKGGESGGGLGDLLGGVLGGAGGGGGLGSVLGQVLKGGGGSSSFGGSGGGMGSIIGALLPAVIGMLTGGGLGKVLGGMRSSGLASTADSWVGTGENEPVSAADISRALGPDEISAIAEKLGIPPEQAAQALAEALPATIDHLTPEGQVPEEADLDQSLGSLKSLLFPQH
jgi:uncharacterized protein YidB (DUF937 family)